MNSKANIVLVHGAWADGSCWNKVIPLLLAKGFHVAAAQIPLTSLEEDIATTRRLLAQQSGPTVLVGHSYGGAVITGAGAQARDVKALVYVAGFGLDEGESLDSLSKQGPPSPGSTQIQPDSDGFLWIKREGFHKAFVGDATVAEAAIMCTIQKPLSIASFTGKMGRPAWKTIPSFYLVSANDQMIPPPAQEFMAKRMNATTSSVPASHVSMVAHADKVADTITQAARSLV
jgi:pimeloyl-ACP methyl ester carboxylesterase